MFGNTGIEFLTELSDAEVIRLFEGVPNFTVSLADILENINVVELLAGKTSVFTSKGEAKKMIQSGGVAINKVKVATETEAFGTAQLINNKFLVAQKGKKNYFLIIAE